MRFLICSCALVLAAGLPAHALSVSPTRIIVKNDDGTQVVLRLSGETGPTPLEVTIIERLPDGAFAAVPGSVIRAHPPQLLLEAGQPRSVRIELSSGIAEETGRSFYLRIEQLGLRSVQVGLEGDPEILLLATYLLPVHVLGGHAEKLVAELVPAPEPVQVVLTNEGQGPALLTGCGLIFTRQTGPEVKVEGRLIAELIGSDAVLPRQAVRLDLGAIFSGKQSQPEPSVNGVRAACDSQL